MKKKRLHGFKIKITQIILLPTIYCLLFTLIGCDAFVRKFTRKPKKDASDREEMVLVPEEYKNPMSKEQQYRQFFIFWRSWQDEVIESLRPVSTSPLNNSKKQVDCVNEAIKNLRNLRAYLKEDRQKQLDTYIAQTEELKSSIADDPSGDNYNWHRLMAERLRRNIIRDFSYNKISKEMI